MTYTSVEGPDGRPRQDMIRRDADGAHIPADPRNTDWQAYQAWLEAGNAPAAAPSASDDDPGATEQ